MIVGAAVALVAILAVVIVLATRDSGTTATASTTEPDVITEADTTPDTTPEIAPDTTPDTSTETTGTADTTEPATTAVTQTPAVAVTEPVPPTEAATTPAVTDVPTAPPTDPPTEPPLNPIDATVVNTCGRSGNGDCFVTVRQAPTAASGEIVRLDEGTPVQVECQTTGQSINSSVLGRSSTVWVRLTGGGFAAAVFIEAPELDPFSVNFRAC